MAKGWLDLHIGQLEGEGLHGLAAWGLGSVPLVVYYSPYGYQPLLNMPNCFCLATSMHSPAVTCRQCTAVSICQ